MALLSQLWNSRMQKLPNQGGSYSSPSLVYPTTGFTKPNANVLFAGPNKTVGPVEPTAVTETPVVPLQSGTQQQQYESALTRLTPAERATYEKAHPQAGGWAGDKWIGEAPAGLPNKFAGLSTQQIVDNIFQDYEKYKSGGQIPDYAEKQFAEAQGKTPPQTVEQMRMDAMALNNARNDIAVGETDPYGSTKDFTFSLAEMEAIRKAGAGVYDPAIDSALAKLKSKEDADKLAAERAFEMEKLAQQHKYTLSENAAKTSGAGLAGNTAGVYVKGQNPIVDGWVERINRTGEDINKVIPGVGNQGLRNAVMIGLNSRKYESAQSVGNLDDINTINDMLANPKLENISGPAGQYVGALWGKAKTAGVQYDKIYGALQVAKAGSIKGQGAVSDFERTVLKQASAAIDRGMNDEEFRKALVKLRGVLMTSSGMEAPVKITDPSSGESDVQNLSTQEINEFIRQGARIEYLEQ